MHVVFRELISQCRVHNWSIVSEEATPGWYYANNSFLHFGRGTVKTNRYWGVALSTSGEGVYNAWVCMCAFGRRQYTG